MTTADWQVNTVPGGTNVARLRRDIGSAAFGNGSTAPAAAAFAAGATATASGTASHAEGNSTTASGPNSHAEGFASTAAGNNSHAEGSFNLAAGIDSHVEGSFSVANANFSHAQGLRTNALREGEHAHSSGPGALTAPNFTGDTQYGLVTMAGNTPGLAVGESVSLLLGASPGSAFPLSAAKAYTFVVTVVMEGQIAGVQRMQSFRRMFAIRPSGGIPTLIASGVAEQIGDAAAASWTITVTAGFFLTIAFSTGATTSAAQATATVEWSEIRAT